MFVRKFFNNNTMAKIKSFLKGFSTFCSAVVTRDNSIVPEYGQKILKTDKDKEELTKAIFTLYKEQCKAVSTEEETNNSEKVTLSGENFKITLS